MSAFSDTQTKDGWRLRAAELNDIDGLHALGANPLVYRYLSDGTGTCPENGVDGDHARLFVLAN